MRQAESLTALVKYFDLSLSPVTIGKALVKAGVMRDVSYLSTTGTGKEKYFKEIVPSYLDYGINKQTMHEFKTDPRFYPENFPHLIFLVIKQLTDELEKINHGHQ